MCVCERNPVIVDYLHSQGMAYDIPVAELQASDSTQTRPILVLTNPRCGICQKPLRYKDLKRRIALKGDLYDRRFRWADIRPFWYFW